MFVGGAVKQLVLVLDNVFVDVMATQKIRVKIDVVSKVYVNVTVAMIVDVVTDEPIKFIDIEVALADKVFVADASALID